MNPKRWQHFDGSDPACDSGPGETQPEGQRCQQAGCTESGDYRAPKSRTEPGSISGSGRYWHFCLEHVRVYNQSWNFYDGMSDVEIALSQRADLLWNRATHPFGNVAPERAARTVAGPDTHSHLFDDPFEIFDSFINDNPSGAERQRPVNPGARLPREIRYALELFELVAPVSAADVKKTYKQLAKRYHPDLNGGSTEDENKLKAINDAYQHIKEGVYL